MATAEAGAPEASSVTSSTPGDQRGRGSSLLPEKRPPPKASLSHVVATHTPSWAGACGGYKMWDCLVERGDKNGKFLKGQGDAAERGRGGGGP